MWKSRQTNNKQVFTHLTTGVLLVVLLIAAGCKSSKKIGKPKESSIQSEAAFFSQIQEQALQFQTLSARLHIDLVLPGKGISSKADFKMIKDSAFQLSIQPFLGIEIFRIEVSRDSIKVIDRLNKRYVSENYTPFRKEVPIEFNFHNLQALFINRLFIPGTRTVSPQDYKRFQMKLQGPSAEFRIKDGMGVLYSFFADGERKLLSTHIKASDSHLLRWDYSDFRLHEEHLFPMKMDVTLSEQAVSKGKLTVAFSRLQTDIPFRMDFSVPSGYQRVTAAQIINLLSNEK